MRLPKRAVVPALDEWIADLFDPGARDVTVAALLASRDGAPACGNRTRADAEQRLTDAETRLRRFQEAIASGVAPEAVADAINQALAQRKAARAKLDIIPATPERLTDADLHALGDRIGSVLTSANAERKPYDRLPWK